MRIVQAEPWLAAAQSPSMLPVPVTVTLDGRVVAASAEASLVGGTVMAAASPYLDAIAARYAVDAAGAIVIEGRGRRITLRFGDAVARLESGVAASSVPLGRPPSRRGGALLVPLAAVARALGYGVRFESDAHVLAIERPEPATVASAAPQTLPPGPYLTFTPASPATPMRPLPSTVPQPRRTPIAEFDPQR